MQYTADMIYGLMSYTNDIVWHGCKFKVLGYDDKQVYVQDTDGEEYHLFYTDMADDLNEYSNTIQFYSSIRIPVEEKEYMKDLQKLWKMSMEGDDHE